MKAASSAAGAGAGAAAGTRLAATGPTTTVGDKTVTGPSREKTAAGAPAAPRLAELTPEDTKALFEDFGIKFEKSYKDDDEKAMRFEIFKRNLKRIDEVGGSVGGMHTTTGGAGVTVIKCNVCGRMTFII